MKSAITICVMLFLPISALFAQRVEVVGNQLVIDATGIKRSTAIGKPATTNATNVSGDSEESWDLASYVNNRQVYQRLQVANTDIVGISWKQAIEQCAAMGGRWRAPTLKEMILMMILEPELKFNRSGSFQNLETTLNNSFYWCATNSEDTAVHWAWVVDMHFKVVIYTGIKSNPMRVRCVKEL